MRVMQVHLAQIPLQKLDWLGDVYVLSVPHPGDKQVASLSPAEREIVEALREGRSNREIAQLRRTSVKTVANQLANLFTRFGVHSRFELLRKLEGSCRP